MATDENDDSETRLQAEVPDVAAGQRFDQVAAALFDQYSRARLKAWIEQGRLSLDGEVAAPRTRVHGGERLELTLPEQGVPASPDLTRVIAEDLPLEIVHEDGAVIVLNKWAGQVMHPAPGHQQGTVMNALLHHAPELANVPRAGIVHRLDRDTTGLCVVARTLQAQTLLVRQLQQRSMGRQYLALVAGKPPPSGSINAAIARHPVDRKRMAVVRTRLRSDVQPQAAHGKPAITHYRVLQSRAGCSLMALNLETGRTHQIRVHMTHIGHPLLGDQTYTQKRSIALLPAAVRAAADDFSRQALHAMRLEFVHPETGSPCRFEVPPPADFNTLLERVWAADPEPLDIAADEDEEDDDGGIEVVYEC